MQIVPSIIARSQRSPTAIVSCPRDKSFNISVKMLYAWLNDHYLCCCSGVKQMQNIRAMEHAEPRHGTTEQTRSTPWHACVNQIVTRALRSARIVMRRLDYNTHTILDVHTSRLYIRRGAPALAAHQCTVPSLSRLNQTTIGNSDCADTGPLASLMGFSSCRCWIFT